MGRDDEVATKAEIEAFSATPRENRPLRIADTLTDGTSVLVRKRSPDLGLTHGD